MLMHEPCHLVWMAHEVRGKLRRNHEVDRLPVALTQIDQPPCGGVREYLTLRIPLERNAHELGLEAAALQLTDERPDEVLCAAPDERNLGLADDDAPNPHQRGHSTQSSINYAACSAPLRKCSAPHDVDADTRDGFLRRRDHHPLRPACHHRMVFTAARSNS